MCAARSAKLSAACNQACRKAAGSFGDSRVEAEDTTRYFEHGTRPTACSGRWQYTRSPTEPPVPILSTSCTRCPRIIRGMWCGKSTPLRCSRPGTTSSSRSRSIGADGSSPWEAASTAGSAENAPIPNSSTSARASWAEPPAPPGCRGAARWTKGEPRSELTTAVSSASGCASAGPRPAAPSATPPRP